MRVLILGAAPALFAQVGEPFSSVRERHVRYARLLLQRHPRGEIRIISFGPRGWPPQGVEVVQGLRLYSSRSFHRASFRVGLLRTLGRVLTEGWRPDVITVQKPWEEGTIGWVASRGVGARFLPQVHFDLFARDWLAESRLNRVRQRSALFLLRRAEGVRVVASTVEAGLAEAGVERDRIRVIPIGVDLRPTNRAPDECKRRIHPDWGGRPVVLFVGRFYRPKNLALWVEVAARVAAEIPEAVFVMAGAGPLEGEIRERAEVRGLAPRFSFPGAIPSPRLAEVYGAADVLLLTSDHEAFGRVIVEAAQAGVAIVSTACAGPRELIRSGETGLLAERGDAAALTQAVLALLRDPSLRNRLTTAARKEVGQRFTIERTARSLIDFWEGR